MPLLLSAPSEEPVSLAEAKAWLRLDTDEEDALVASLLAASRDHVERATRRLLVAQTWRLRWDICADELRFPFAPLRSIVAIRLIDAAGATHELAPSQWRLVGAHDDQRVRIATNLGGSVEVDAEFGYGAASETPEPLRQAIRMLVAAWFEHRGDAQPPPSATSALIAPFIRVRL